MPTRAATGLDHLIAADRALAALGQLHRTTELGIHADDLCTWIDQLQDRLAALGVGREPS